MAIFIGTPMGVDETVHEIFHDDTVRADRLAAEVFAYQLQRSTEQPRIVCGDRYVLVQGLIDPNEDESIYDGVDCNRNEPYVAPRDIFDYGW